MAGSPELAHFSMPPWKRKGAHSKQVRKLAEGTLVRAIPLPPCNPAAQYGVVCAGLFGLWGCLEGKSKEGPEDVEMSCSLPHKGWLQGSLRRCSSVAGMATEHVGCTRILGPASWGKLQRKLINAWGLTVLPLWGRGG